jgi:hypothetical protein
LKTTLQIGQYVADIYANTREKPPVFHYIITRQGSSEIIYWGQEASEDEALQCAESYIRGLNARAATSAG